MDHYAEICRRFRWEVPAEYNLAAACCGRWAGDSSRLALRWEDGRGGVDELTFAEVQRQANRLSNALAGLGIRRGDRVAIVLPQRPEMAIAYMAVFQMGAIGLPLSHLFGPDALEHRLENAGAALAIVEARAVPMVQAIRPRLPELRHLVTVDAAGTGSAHWPALLASASDRFQPVVTRAHDPALIIFTSGTTGPAKGALMAHRTLLGNLPGFVHSHDLYPQPGDLFWSPADWAWTGGLFDALLPAWSFGQPLVGYTGRFEPERAFQLLERHGVRNTFLFPTALKQMMKAAPEPRQKYRLQLRTIMSAGEPVGTTLIEWGRVALGVTINEMYGQTEANYVVGNCQAQWPVKPGAIGRAYPGHRVAVIDETGDELPPGQLGEIAVRAEGDPVMFLEYWRNPTATAEKFVRGWARTGDQGRMDPDGYLWYQGRTDDVIKSAGYRIGPAEIESCLLKHPSVANAAVIGKPDDERGMIVKAFIVLQPGRVPDPALEDDIKAHVRSRLAPYEYPKEVEFIAELPLTVTGKVRRNELRQREAAKR